MDLKIQNIKGLHPGLFLNRELKKRGISKGPFALSIGEYPQTISAITHGKRGMNTSLSLRIEESLNLEEGILMILQVYYDIKMEKEKRNKALTPDLTKLRNSLFWDTKFEKIDWVLHKRFVIERIIERGNDAEKDEIMRFYNLSTLESNQD
jgi:plasmid maintenance system antidote protein VapI